MKAKFFKTQNDFRKWLEKNHLTKTELIVGFYKVNSGKASMSWSQSVDQALCFGWIDGIRKTIDADSYQIRFTPRRADSIWSSINIQKISELTKQGLMKPEGISIFEKRKDHKSEIYTHEIETPEFSREFQKKFKANKIAWRYFQSLAPSYQKLSTNWVMSAKQESTKLKRLEELIQESEAQINKWKNNKYQKK